MIAPKEIWLRAFRFEGRVIVTSSTDNRWLEKSHEKAGTPFLGPAVKALVHEDGRIEVQS
ncbi:MAG: hypothetical protein ABFD81_18075 [Syntrophaceae bacterium]